MVGARVKEVYGNFELNSYWCIPTSGINEAKSKGYGVVGVGELPIIYKIRAVEDRDGDLYWRWKVPNFKNFYSKINPPVLDKGFIPWELYKNQVDHANTNINCDDNHPEGSEPVFVYRDNDRGGGDGYKDKLSKGEWICVFKDKNKKGDKLIIPPGFVAHYDVLGIDCDDTNREIFKMEPCWVDNDGDNKPKNHNAIWKCSGVKAPKGFMFVTPAPKPETDCNDNDPLIWELKEVYADKDGDGHAASDKLFEVCLGNLAGSGYVLKGSEIGLTDCNDSDPTKYKRISAGYDGDGDGWITGSSNWICWGDGPLEPGMIPGENIKGRNDCDDTNPAIWRIEKIGIDSDGDGWIVGSGFNECIGLKAPAGYTYNFSGINDCDDSDPLIKGAVPIYTDKDGDGWVIGPPEDFCPASEALPAGKILAKDVKGYNDCNDNDREVFQLVLLGIDMDHDGYKNGTEMICIGYIIPSGYTSLPAKDDCNDYDSEVFQLVLLGIDKDNDGCHAGTEKVCMGISVPSGYTRLPARDDYDDNNRNICSKDSDNDGYSDDNDCAPYNPLAWRWELVREYYCDGYKPKQFNNYTMCIGKDTVLPCIPKPAGPESDFSVYPNPVRDQLNIVPNDGWNQLVEIKLVDEFGRVAKALKAQAALKGQTISINTSTLKPGIYRLIIQRGELIESKTIAVKL